MSSITSNTSTSKSMIPVLDPAGSTCNGSGSNSLRQETAHGNINNNNNININTNINSNNSRAAMMNRCHPSCGENSELPHKPTNKTKKKPQQCCYSTVLLAAVVVASFFIRPLSSTIHG
uniref:Uncharacterized protein n=1 Tax=Pseudo-nitzschia australis TaxID=44445 RepID=A0A7S4AN95_9STRA|mmetsp:Transcript_22780/g.49578  ORF Transcript_22780/g.49578 Transcript_22780/m.49578 type:complete len:119 (+) Transcript_22780:55-411(+)